MVLERKKKKIIYFSVILLFLFVISNINSNNQFILTESDNNDENNPPEKLVKDQALDFENNNVSYSGIGSPWNVTHYGNSTINNRDISFTNGSYDNSQGVELKSGWEGYELEGNIYNLYDIKNWNNGSYHYGDDSGMSGLDHSSYITNEFQNWTFYEIDPSNDNDMSGTYNDDILGHDCLELNMYGDDSDSGWYVYDEGDRCMWNSSFEIERGRIIDSELQFDINPYHVTNFNSWEISVYLENKKIYSIGIYTIKKFGAGQWKTFKLPQVVWTNISNIFPTGEINGTVIDISIELGYNSFSARYSEGFTNIEYQQLYVDNIKLITKTEVKPNQINLKMNDSEVYLIDSKWGQGSVKTFPDSGNWQGDTVYANFSGEHEWLFDGFTSNYLGVTTFSSYKVVLKSDLNLYALKNNPDTNWKKDVDEIGTYFSVSNNSEVIWNAYTFVNIPSDYEETNMTIEFPSDITITKVYDSADNEVLAGCTTTYIGNIGKINIPISSISSATPVFWSLEATSSNYCQELTIYKNSTVIPTSTDWAPSTSFFSGDYLNITAKIDKSTLIQDYITLTNASLTIRLPDESIWLTEQQTKEVKDDGTISFDYIKILDEISPYYQAGEYEAVVTWNNSFSSFGVNESGIIYKKFNVTHNSILEPDRGIYYFEDIFDDTIVNIYVYYQDAIDSTGIIEAEVCAKNTSIGIQDYEETLTRISEVGIYWLAFNASEAEKGNNTITIYANSSFYTNRQINITIDVIKQTKLVVDEDYITVPYNQNFTIQVNYTELNSGDHIVIDIENDFSTTWNGDSQLVQNPDGSYNLTCNNSLYTANELHTFLITIDPDQYQAQSKTIGVFITELGTTSVLFLNGTERPANYVYSVELTDYINVTVSYRDIGGNHISGANISRIIGGGLTENLTENKQYEQYSKLLYAKDFGEGIASMNVIIKKDNYNQQIIPFTIDIFQKKGDLELFLNGINRTLDDYVDYQWGDELNITVFFTDNETGFIDGATVEIRKGTTILYTIPKDSPYEQYNRTINTAELGVGIHSLTITATKENYGISTKNIIITITLRDTSMEILVDGESTSTFDYFNTSIGKTVNITVFYIDVNTTGLVYNADINLLNLGSPKSIIKNDYYEQYNITLNASDFGTGIKTIEIIAERDNYTSRSESITFFIIERATEIFLYVNGTYLEDGEQYPYDVENRQHLNISVIYRDDITDSSLSGANVTLYGLIGGEVKLSPYLDRFNITIDVSDVKDEGVAILTILAEYENYQTQTIDFRLTITKLLTNLEILFNGVNVTLDPSTDPLPIGTLINITIRYTDIYGDKIDNANVTLGIDYIASLTLDSTYPQYTIIINTNVLKLGINIISLEAKSSNYEIQNDNIRIQVRRVRTEIDTEDGDDTITIRPGEDAKITIEVKDLDFGGGIEDAEVTYDWKFGDGDLDDEGDGLYEVTFEDVPEGTYTITITVYKEGGKYDFDEYEITLVVKRPAEENLLFQILLIIAIIVGIGLASYLIAYQKYLKYPKPVRKVRKYRRTLKRKRMPKVDITSREKAFNKIYSEEIKKTSKLAKSKPKEVIASPRSSIKKKLPPKQPSDKPVGKETKELAKNTVEETKK
jgi:hypothetical protein